MTSAFEIIQSDTELTRVPDQTVVVHSTNCFGNWGAGFALALHEFLPAADKVYKDFCDDQRPDPDQWPARDKTVGRCLLIPPQKADSQANGQQIWVACLFTSYGYGRPTKKKAGKDNKSKIVQQTKAALDDLYAQLDAYGESNLDDTDERSGNLKMEIYSPKINSGSFCVKWEDTQSMIEDSFKGWNGKWHLFAPHS